MGENDAGQLVETNLVFKLHLVLAFSLRSTEYSTLSKTATTLMVFPKSKLLLTLWPRKESSWHICEYQTICSTMSAFCHAKHGSFSTFLLLAFYLYFVSGLHYES